MLKYQYLTWEKNLSIKLVILSSCVFVFYFQYYIGGQLTFLFALNVLSCDSPFRGGSEPEHSAKEIRGEYSL